MNQKKNFKNEHDKLDEIFEFIFDVESMEASELDNELRELGLRPEEMGQRIQGIVQDTLELAQKPRIDWTVVNQEREDELRKFDNHLKINDSQNMMNQTDQLAWLKQAINRIGQTQPSFAVEHRNFEKLSPNDLYTLIQDVKFLLNQQESNSDEP
jgi:hypothetical protein